MNKDEILRFISGLTKKHGTSFGLKIKYLTDSGKTRNRAGQFVKLINDQELVLFNAAKNSEGHYFIERITAVAKYSN